MKDEFLATLSHELRTPLHAILGWTQLVKRKVQGTELAEDVAVIERNTRTQSQLIEDLLDLSRIVTGKLRLNVRKIDLVEVVNDALNAVQVAAEAKGITVKEPDARQPIVVDGDPARLQQVVWNLLSNAVKFTSRQGQISVEVAREDGYVTVKVTDTGQGIGADFLPHIFERFMQEDATVSRQYAGLGIGLALVKHLVELHGGTVHADSEGKGQGATFTVRLPVQPGQEPRMSDAEHLRAAGDLQSPGAGNGFPVSAAPQRPFEGLKVLAIDDEPDARELVRRLLSDTGAQVFLAATAAEGFELFRRERPDLVLCDIGMPGEDGYRFTQRIRVLSMEEGGRTPIVAVTAFARTEERVAAVAVGFTRHLAKPFEPDELFTVVSETISKSRAVRS